MKNGNQDEENAEPNTTKRELKKNLWLDYSTKVVLSILL